MMRRAGRRQGMTFLEVMVVLLILGLLLAVVIPNMAGPRAKTALRTSARDLAAAGLLARQSAISTGENTYLIFNLDEKQGAWRLQISPADDDNRRRGFGSRDERIRDPQTSDEQPRELPKLVGFSLFKNDQEEFDNEDQVLLTFFPSGACSGMAIQLKNTRDKTLVVDFDPVTGKPEVYPGEPKSVARKLRERGLNPEDYGLVDDTPVTEVASTAGEGFYTSSGMNSTEREQYYEDAVTRMLQRAETKKRIAEEGIGAYYSEASQWGN